MRQKKQRCSGMTLFEVVISIAVLAVLVGAMAPMTFSILTSEREHSTREKTEEIFGAIMGNPKKGGLGFLGDIGRLPANNSLEELLTNVNNLPLYAVDPTTGVGAGWRGPYVSSDGSTLVDEWGNPFIYNSSTGQITSYGPNGVSGGGDDIVFPAAPLFTTQLSAGKYTVKGTLQVTLYVNDVPNAKGTSVKVYSPQEGVLVASATLNQSDANFPTRGFPFSVPQGMHVVEGKHTPSSQALPVVTKRVPTMVLADKQGTFEMRVTSQGAATP